MILELKLLIGAVILAVIAYFVYDYNSTRKDLEVATTKLNVLNAQIDILKQETEKKLAAGKAATEAANKVVVKQKEKVVTIYKTLPAVPGDDCKSALILGNTP